MAGLDHLAIKIVARAHVEDVVHAAGSDIGCILHLVARVVACIALEGHDHHLTRKYMHQLCS